MVRTVIFEEREKWSGAVALSAGLHALLAITVIVIGLFGGPHGEDWGGSSSGEAVQVSLESAIPLPAPQNPTQNIVATENKGITQSVPQQAWEEQNAVPIPETQHKKKVERTQTTQTVTRPQPQPPKDNVVPYGEGGPISGPYGTFTTAHTKGGFNYESAGDFGTRFAWYAQTVNRKVSENWYTVELNAGAQGHRVYLLFDIQKDGSVSNVRIEQSSGIPALDQSAVRALQRIDTFGPLPAGYSGSYLRVEFWFEPPR
jgi:periplasmic protein TonB